MQLNATLTHLAAQRGALVAAAAAPQFTALVDRLQVRCLLHLAAGSGQHMVSPVSLALTAYTVLRMAETHCWLKPVQEHSAEVGDSISEVVRRLEVTRAQKSEGEAYRGACCLQHTIA